MARVAQKRIILDVKSTPLSTTDEITEREWDITAAIIFTPLSTTDEITEREWDITAAIIFTISKN